MATLERSSLATTVSKAPGAVYWWKRGHWWWLPETSEANWQHVVFRKTLTVTVPPATLPMAVCADAMYRLHVNGRFVMHGPARSLRDCATVDELDLAPWLVKGINVVAAEVVYRPSGRWDAGYICQAPGLFFAVDLSGCPNTTESSWRCLEPQAYDDSGPLLGNRGAPVEMFDARRLDPAWKSASFDDAKWAEAHDLGSAGTPPRVHMEPRDVPLPEMKLVKAERIIGFERGGGDLGSGDGGMLGPDPNGEFVIRMQNESRQPATQATEAVWPIRLPGDAHDVTVDFGLPHVGFLGLDVEGEEGTLLDVAWHEVLWSDGSVRPCLNLPLRQVFRYTLRKGRQQFLLMAPNTARYIRIVNRGRQPVTVHAVPLYTYVAPRPAGTFTCSHETLNRVFEAALVTANNSVIDLYMDNPERERNAWFHDSYWSCFAHTLLSGDASVLRRMCRMGSASFVPAGETEIVSPFVPPDGTLVIPGHSLFWLLQAKLDSDLSGRNDYAPQVAEGIHRFLSNIATFENKEGLLEKVRGWNWLDWSRIRKDDVMVPLNALYSRALDAAADMTGMDKYRDKASAIRETLCRLCPGTLFPDCLLREEDALTPSPERAEGTQYFALWCGVPDEERRKALWLELRDGSDLAGANTYTYVQRLHYAALQGDIEALVRDIIKVYGFQVDHAPGTLSERLGGGPSYCQGVAAGVAVSLMQGVLGVQPIEGYRYVRIAPGTAGDVTWCRGMLPTTLGWLGISWAVRNEDFQLQATLPEGTRARIVLPSAAREIWEQKPSTVGWPDGIEIERSAKITVLPGEVKQSG